MASRFHSELCLLSTLDPLIVSTTAMFDVSTSIGGNTAENGFDTSEEEAITP